VVPILFPLTTASGLLCRTRSRRLHVSEEHHGLPIAFASARHLAPLPIVLFARAEEDFAARAVADPARRRCDHLVLAFIRTRSSLSADAVREYPHRA